MYNTGNIRYKSVCKRLLSLLLVVAIVVTGLKLEAVIAKAATTDEASTIQIYLVDNTAEKWVGNDNAVIELVDNSSGHDHYEMTKVNDTTWSVTVPESAYNITFNRYSPDKSTQWNSWSAGGRDEHNAYYADGSEYGHWETIEVEEENYFHAGDIIYLDVSEFAAWEKDNAKMYINFTDASKEENGGNDIAISGADRRLYNPKPVGIEVTESIYAYVVTFEDEGKTELRFWRGNDYALWNCSVVLTYEDYVSGMNCVKIGNWNNSGEIFDSEHSIDVNKDTDGDGLADYYEMVHSTDIFDTDTDDDGLTDYQEINETGTSPLVIDTNGNEISDANEDNDKDGITNNEEYRLGTSIYVNDTDVDSLLDYDEVYIYKTNPLCVDTDGDGANDRWEIENEYNPNIYNEYFEVFQTQQGESTYIEVELIANGSSASSFSCEIYENSPNGINSTIPGYLGSGYDFHIDGEFKSVNIKYYFKEEYIKEEGFEPVVYYYNEETNEMEEVDTVWDGVSNFVTSKLTHFSTYLLLNKTKFDEVWNTQIKTIAFDKDEPLNINVAFVVDLSGSMSGTKLSTTKTAIKSFINVLEENDCAGLITFTNNAIVHSELTNNKESLISKIDSMSAHGLTSIYAGLHKGVEMLSNSVKDGYNMIIVFTDGYDEPSTTYELYYEKIVDKAVDNKITIYTIGIQTVDEGLLTKVAETTGGHYYYASLISELEDKIDKVKDEVEGYKKDTNNDGISDYYTKLICEGKLRYSNGTAVQGFIGNYIEIQKNADYDGDGLLNGEEIKVGTTSGGRPCVEMISNPIFADTDLDGIDDGTEKNRAQIYFIQIYQNWMWTIC